MNEKIDYKGWKYQIFSDGYELWGDNNVYITQHAPYDKNYVPDGSYEDNAKAQIDELTQPAMPTDTEKMRADIDYIAMEMDIDLDA